MKLSTKRMRFVFLVFIVLLSIGGYRDYCEIVLSRSNTACFDILAGAHPTIARMAWMVPVEPELPDTELAPGKVTIIHGRRPSGLACHGYVPRNPKLISRRLYLQKKSLLC